MFSKEVHFSGSIIFIYCLIWYIFTVLTYGTAIPAGLFLPGILIGCALGRVYTHVISTFDPTALDPAHAATFSIMGAAAVLSGYSRLTYSLGVLMMETTQSVDLFIPIIFTLFFSFLTGAAFNKSLYALALKSKSIPVLVKEVPPENSKMQALDIM